MSPLGDWRGLVDRLLGRDRGATHDRGASPPPSPPSRDQLFDRIHSGLARKSRSAEDELLRRDNDELARLDAALMEEASSERGSGVAGQKSSDVPSTDPVAPTQPAASIEPWPEADRPIKRHRGSGERVDEIDEGVFESLFELPFDVGPRDASSTATGDTDDPLDGVVVDGSLDAHEHAWSLATAMLEIGVWKKDDVHELVAILTDSSDSRRRRALMRQLERGAAPETLRIAHLVRARWNDEYGNGPRRHLSWDAAVDLAGAFAGHPSVDEALCQLATIHETYERVRWYEPESRGGFSPFVEILVATASSDGGRLLAKDAVNRASGGWTLA